MEAHPKIKFVLSKRHEISAAIGFIRDRKGTRAIRFLKKFLPVHLHFLLANNFSDKERGKIIKSYVADFYKYEGNKFKTNLKTIESDWKSVEGRYFRLVDRLFNRHPWPKGKYIGWATIFWCYPRFISEKTFFLPTDHRTPRYANGVIAHEMLHFMFFDYVERKYGLGEHAKIRGEESNYLWKVSEAFNSVIEGWPPYQKLFNTTSKPYPETISVFKKMDAQWKRKQDVDALLKRILKITTSS